MGRKKGTNRKVSKDKVNFGITLLTVSIIFIFLGYLMGQYAVSVVGQSSRPTPQVTQTQSINQQIEEGLENLRQSGQSRPESARQEEPAAPASSTAESNQTANSLFRVQVGAFSQRENAIRLRDQLSEAGHEAVITSGPPFRVQTGAFSSRDNAERLMNTLRSEGFEATIVR